MQRGVNLTIVFAVLGASIAVVGSSLRAQDRDKEESVGGTKDGGPADGGAPDGGVRKVHSKQTFLSMKGDVEAARALLPRLLRWARPTGQTTVFDLACRPILVKRDGRALIGETPEAPGKGRVWWGVSFSEEVQVTGPNFRSPTGRDRGALSSLETIELALSRVTSDAAWYGDTNPLIFRSLEACQLYRQKHRLSREDLNPWPAFGGLR